jgi:acid stress chaperone HdeB
MRRMLVVFGVTLATLAVPAVQAQVTIDVSKITCNQMFAYKIADPSKIALWLSGYYNGKRGTTIVDTQQFSANASKLEDYCLHNPQMPAMQAVGKLFGTGK